MNNRELADKISGDGFIAALDQSGGSTPKALTAYGISESDWATPDDMFRLVHEMRTRILTNPAFDDRISGVILFERTMNDTIQNMPTPQFLSEEKKVAPFLKIDDGLEEKDDNIQLMKPIDNLEERLKKAVENGIFGTKMRSVIYGVNPTSTQRIVDQQFAVASKIIESGLMPIIEPEVDINASNKGRAETILREQLQKKLDSLPEGQKVMLKLTLPEEANLYQQLVEHPRVLRVVALSGGYPRDLANAKLSENTNMTASFSRALVEDLNIGQTEEEFTAALDAAIQSIYDASLNSHNPF